MLVVFKFLAHLYFLFKYSALLQFWSCSAERCGHFVLNVDVSPIMIISWHQEIACFLSLEWHYFAVCCELVSAWEFVLWIFVHIQLLVLLRRLHQIALDEHFNLQSQIILVGIAANPKEVEAVLLVDGVFHVVELTSIILKELVSSVVGRKLDRLVQFVEQWAAYYFYLSIRGALLSLLHLLELDILCNVLLMQLHVNLRVRVDIDHPLLICVLIAGLREMLF